MEKELSKRFYFYGILVGLTLSTIVFSFSSFLDGLFIMDVTLLTILIYFLFGGLKWFKDKIY